MSTPEPQSSPLGSALSVLATLGPPLTIFSALLLYFGWARSDEQARAMGLDVSLFGFTTQDYVLRSISTLYVPLLVIAAVTLGWLAMHQRLAKQLGRPSARRRLKITGRVGVVVGLLAAAGAILAATIDEAILAATIGEAGASLLVPLALAAGVAVARYGGWLAVAADDLGSDDPPPPWQRALRTLLVTIVITLALFWELSNFAAVVGRGYAQKTADDLATLPRATAFSPTPLGIQAQGVVEEPLALAPGAAPDAVRYRTSGMRLLVRSGERLFLLHDGWTPRRGSVIVLPDNDAVRWQFSR